MHNFRQEIAQLRGEIVALNQKNNTLELQNKTLLNKQPVIDVLNFENDELHTKFENAVHENKKLTEKLEKLRRINKLENENNVSLTKRIIQLTQNIKSKPIEYDNPSKLEEALLSTSKKLGVALSTIAFLQNQLKKNSQQINQQIKVLDASQHKEELTKLHCQEKLDRLSSKNKKSKEWYNTENTKLNKKLKMCSDENANLKEQVEYKSKQLAGMSPHLASNKQDLTLLEELNEVYEVKYSDVSKMSKYLRNERTFALNLERKYTMLQKTVENIRTEFYQQKEIYYKTIKNLDDIREASNIVSLQKLSDSQEECRNLSAKLSRSKLLQENIKLEILSSQLNY